MKAERVASEGESFSSLKVRVPATDSRISVRRNWRGRSLYMLAVLFLFSTCARADFRLTTLTTVNGTTDGAGVIGLTQGSDGNLYGVTVENGSNDSGTTFKVNPAGILTILANLNATNGNGSGPLIQAFDGNFYAVQGDAVYRMTTNGEINIVKVFKDTNSLFYGANSPLVQGKDGNLYGTTEYGLGNYLGTVFKLTPTGDLTTLVVLMGTNGEFPTAGLTLGNDGAFYGTTSGRDVSFGVDATIFKITPEGALTTLVYFDSAEDNDLTPGLVLGPDGNLYGMTIYGSTQSSVMVFKMTPSGNLTTLARFTNGAAPLNLVLGKDGNFYGTAANSTVFQMTTNGVFTTIISLPSGSGLLMAGSDGNL